MLHEILISYSTSNIITKIYSLFGKARKLTKTINAPRTNFAEPSQNHFVSTFTSSNGEI
jgi:hypothetical protein